MKYSIKTLLFQVLVMGFVFNFLAINHSNAQTKSERIDELIGLYQEYGQFNGSVLVANQGEIIYKGGVGLANMEWNIPNDSDTKHRLGSISKQFTAMLILQFVAEGKLDLQVPIVKYLPDYPAVRANKITLHHLLTHTSGTVNYTSLPGIMQKESKNHYSPDEFIGFFADSTLRFEPGEQFEYSNSGYFLLGLILEKESGKSYEDLLDERIFQVLGMHDSGYDSHEEIIMNRATGYEKRGNSYLNAPYLDMSIPYAAGSLYSTAKDLYLWDQALYSNKLLSEDYMEMYFKPYVAAMGGHYSYGWAIIDIPLGNSADRQQVIAHGGGINGFNTLIARAPEDKSFVILLNNTGTAPLHEMLIAIKGIMYEKDYDMPKASLAKVLIENVEKDGLEKALLKYEEMKQDDSFNLNEQDMNSAGYLFLQSGKLKEALAVFKLNVDAFPDSFNVYDSYAEAFMMLGMNKEAIRYYEKSIKMNPMNQNGKDMLKKLGIK